MAPKRIGPRRESSVAARLRQALIERFSLEELEVLASDVGATWDNLHGDTLLARASSLVAWAERNDRLLALLIAVVNARPGVDWSL